LLQFFYYFKSAAPAEKILLFGQKNILNTKGKTKARINKHVESVAKYA
jgi:hypothetical protein